MMPSKLQTENDRLREGIDHLTAELAGVKQERDAQFNAKNAMASENGVLWREIGNLKEKLLANTNEVEHLRCDSADLAGTIGAMTVERADLKAALAKAESERDGHRADVAHAEREIERQLAETTALKTNNAELGLLAKSWQTEAKGNAQKCEAESAALNTALAERTVAWAECGALRLAIDTLKAANAALTAGICGGCKAAKARVADLVQSNAELREQYCDLCYQRPCTCDTLEKLQGKIAELEVEVAGLNSTLAHNAELSALADRETQAILEGQRTFWAHVAGDYIREIKQLKEDREF